jgi:hypothetical protein
MTCDLARSIGIQNWNLQSFERLLQGCLALRAKIMDSELVLCTIQSESTGNHRLGYSRAKRITSSSDVCAGHFLRGGHVTPDSFRRSRRHTASVKALECSSDSVHASQDLPLHLARHRFTMEPCLGLEPARIRDSCSTVSMKPPFACFRPVSYQMTG